ncbi:MAG: hypothetical protein Q9190_006623 [Brigantiaea leucoxantha]
MLSKRESKVSSNNPKPKKRFRDMIFGHSKQKDANATQENPRNSESGVNPTLPARLRIGSDNSLLLKRESSTQSPSKSKDPSLIEDQVHSLPQIGDEHSHAIVAGGPSGRSKDLWMLAYETLKLRDLDLIVDYENCLAATIASSENYPQGPLNPELIKAVVERKLQDHEAKKLILHIRGKAIKVREQGEKVIKFILWSNGFVSAAVSAQPYAALAWSGVSLLLPNEAMIKGLDAISHLLRLYKIREELYLQDAQRPAPPEFVEAVVELYSNIFEYQAQLIVHLSQSSVKRGFRKTFNLQDWKELLTKVEMSSNRCTEYIALFDKEKEHQFYAEQSTQINSSELLKKVIELFEASIAARQQSHQDDNEAQLLESLASDYKDDKNSVSERVDGTCEWFFQDSRFLKWRDAKTSSLLWVSAGPGCGKSVLSRALIDERKTRTSATTSTVCYFFFKDGQEQRTRGANALSALLHQLFENTALITYALPSYRSYGKKLREVFSELWEILVKSAQDLEAGEVICILDALDECEEDARKQLITKLVAFYSELESQDASLFTLKFLVTSRPYEDLEHKFQSLSGNSTYLHFDGGDKSQQIGQEINLVIDAKIPDIAGQFNEKDRKHISKRLKSMKNRTYLWLFLTIDIIETSRSNFSKMSSLESLLNNLPSKISDAYERILSRSTNINYARILFQLIVVATRPLSLKEANVALTVATQTSCTSQKDLELWPSQSFKSAIHNICGLMISVYDGKIYLAHQTVREFLLGTEQSSSYPVRWQGCIDIASAHSIAYRVCLTYLSFDDFVNSYQNRDYDSDSDDSYSSDSDIEQEASNFPLLRYAALNWFTHYNSQNNEMVKNYRKTAKTLCSLASLQNHQWFQLFYKSDFEINKEWTGLQLASQLRLVHVIEVFLNEGADVNAKGGDHGTALIIASSRGHFQIVQLLLDNGANINAQGGFHGNALCAASFTGEYEIVQLLLENRADVNAQGGFHGNALCAASFVGEYEIVQLLLDSRADINAQGGDYSNALQGASSKGNNRIVKLLLDSGADINAQGPRGNALQVASSNGYYKTVQLLLDSGADINAQGPKGNALRQALSHWHDQVAHLLFDKGARIPFQGARIPLKQEVGQT